MSSHPKKERSFVIIKPDGIQRSLVGEIIKRFERTGLKLVALKLAVPQADKIWKHYNKDDEWFLKKGTNIAAERAAAGLPVDKEPIEYGKDIIRALEKYMTAGPVVMMVWEGNQAVGVVTKLTGTTEPCTSDVGTIRGDYTIDSYAITAVDDRAVRNLIHCSDTPENAETEIKLWLSEDEVLDYRLIGDQILYDVNLDGILE
ncbi:nucleoside-diphosphate kinase [Patescibacteria group bacterium]|nr:nucleoside-diphosphate kinase [Patescibacteria group bacterium]MBU0860305.1 nucleoside-diphosphate kinase [Alphaproteobacteria bacterium]MBU1755115.1 nucleoside-diphosphate kinase [Patescibacteria group bacterium]